ncbi:hypothetical protein THAOC_15967 [Thalassiosira oceanica]|uniref:Uncharacterized protein n=1 Tax=Thalassiosira oceanica TaxID=159749 RepID=K0SDC5_THAOC|nr:hypothetical protein THAOC_15967 [Thalassiosira oceanica]|eukprot:EJK63375.1 hypothetical protein THAOC_15967 [Thalassiosira oceanica]
MRNFADTGADVPTASKRLLAVGSPLPRRMPTLFRCSFHNSMMEEEMEANIFDSPLPPLPPLPPPESRSRDTTAAAGLRCLSQAAAQAPRAAAAQAPRAGTAQAPRAAAAQAPRAGTAQAPRAAAAQAPRAGTAQAPRAAAAQDPRAVVGTAASRSALAANRPGVEPGKLKCDCRKCPSFPDTDLMKPTPCSNPECNKRVHFHCWNKLRGSSKATFPDEFDELVFCTIGCAKNYKRCHIVVTYNWRNDGKNGPQDPNNSETYLVNVMSSGNNYANYRSPPAGHSKLSWCNKLASDLNSSNLFMREITGAQVKSKLEDIEKSWKAADYFVNSETGAGVKARSEGEFTDAVLAKCPHYYDLYDVFIDRASFKPKATNKHLQDSDSSEMSDIDDYGEGGGFDGISVEDKDDKSIASNKSVISLDSSSVSVKSKGSTVSNLADQFATLDSPYKRSTSRRGSSTTGKKGRSKSAPASSTTSSHAFKACLLPTEFAGLNAMAAEFTALEAEAEKV